MRILLLNQNWFADEWRKAGHTVISCGRYPYLDVHIPDKVFHIQDVLTDYFSGFEPDRIVIYDDSSPITFAGLDDLEVPLFFYSVDTHHHFEMHRELRAAVDGMVVAQADYLDYMTATGESVGWMPLWASVEYGSEQHSKEFDACFVGTLNPILNPRRVEFLKRLQSCAPITVTSGIFADIFPKSHIILNQTVKQDLNFRVFEAMISGSLVLTERINNRLFDLFREGEHLVTYTPDDHLDAAEKIAFYRSQPKEARRIGEAGRAEILRAHLPRHRAAQLLDEVEKVTYQRERQRHIGMMTNHVYLSKVLRAEPRRLSQVRALAAAMIALDRALQSEESITLGQASLAAVGCLEYDSILVSKAGSILLARAAEAWHQYPFLQVVRIWTLLQQGETEEARRHAERVFPEQSEEMCNRAAEITGMVINAYGGSPATVP